MLQHLSGGQWGLVGRRVFEAAARTCRSSRCSSCRSCSRCRRCSSGRGRKRSRRRDPPDEGAVPERRRSSSSARSIYFAFWMLCVVPAEQAGRPRRIAARSHRRRPTCVRFRTRQRAGAALPRADDHLRVGRLGHVARPALVLDDLRPADRSPAGACRRFAFDDRRPRDRSAASGAAGRTS